MGTFFPDTPPTALIISERVGWAGSLASMKSTISRAVMLKPFRWLTSAPRAINVFALVISRSYNQRHTVDSEHQHQGGKGILRRTITLSCILSKIQTQWWFALVYIDSAMHTEATNFCPTRPDHLHDFMNHFV